MTTQCPGSQTISLLGCVGATDEGVMALAGSCTGLTSINLEGCNKVADISSWHATKCVGLLITCTCKFGLHDLDAHEFVNPEQYVANLNDVQSSPRASDAHRGVHLGELETYSVSFRICASERQCSAVQRSNSLASRLLNSKPGVVINDLVSS